MDVSSITDRLTNKVGPLPAWAWAAIPATAYIGWSYYQRSQQPEETATEETTDTGTTEETSDYGINTGGSYLPSYGAAPTGTSQLPYVDTPEYDNETWFRQASNYLITEGVSPSDIITALNAYIYGNPTVINSTQMAALQRAIIKFGVAPEGGHMPTVSGTPTPTPPAKPKPIAITGLRIARKIRVTGAGKSSMVVAWDMPANARAAPNMAIDLMMERKAVPGVNPISSVKATVNTFTRSGLTIGQSYRFRVRERVGVLAYGPWSAWTVWTVL